MKEIQSVAIIGMGALGLLFGDILQRGGAKVCFIADEQRQAKVAHTPITINGEARRFDMIAPDQIGASFDLILFAVKATGLKQAMADAARAIGEDTAIVSLLNGITSEALLAERFGARNVVGCVAQGMDAVREGTSLRYTHPGMLVIGAQDSEQEPALARVAKLFARSDVPFQIDSDIRHRLWSKFMLNVGVNQVVMAAEGTYATVQRAGAARERMIAAMREVIALAQLEGVCVTEDDLRYYVDLMDTLSPDGMPSMRQDGLAHRPSEVELFSGTVCQMAKKHGLSVPINEALYREICTMEADYMNTTKTFHAETVTDEIVRWIQDFFAKNGPDCNTVVGISGGKDSSVAAALCAKALGKERVIGVLMPNGIQHDIDMARLLVDHLGIERYEVNIHDSLEALKDAIPLELSEMSKVNLPPRVRMATLYAVSQSRNGRVVNTCNLSENWVGYSTRYGDAAGDFSPLGKLTVDEVKQVGRVLGLPDVLVDKVPIDGLCGKTDEDNLGFTYAELDRYIRTGEIDDAAHKEKIDRLHARNLFKLQMMPEFELNLPTIDDNRA